MSVFASWEISRRQLSARPAQLLHIMSFFHHEGIAEALFEAASARAGYYKPQIPLTEAQAATQTIIYAFLISLRTSSDEWDMLALRDLTDELRAFSLLDYDPQSCSYSMHPLVQEWSRSTAPDISTSRECATWVLALCVKNERGSEHYAFRRQLLPHLLALDSDHTQLVPELANWLSHVYYEAGYERKREALMTIALQASRDKLGNEHLTTLACIHNLADAFLGQRRLEEAVELLTEVIEVKKRVCGYEHPETFASMHALALAYRDQKRWQEAEELLLEVVELQKRVNGPEGSRTLASTGALASTYRNQGRLPEAEELHVQVLGMKMRLLGREHPNTLAEMHNLARTYSDQGKLREAESLMEETVSLYKKVLGESHKETQLGVRHLDGIRERMQAGRLSNGVL